MRKLMLLAALVVTLLGAIGLGTAHELSSAHPVAAHTHLLVDGTPSPLTLCGGSAPTFC